MGNLEKRTGEKESGESKRISRQTRKTTHKVHPQENFRKSRKTLEKERQARENEPNNERQNLNTSPKKSKAKVSLGPQFCQPQSELGSAQNSPTKYAVGLLLGVG